MTSGTGWPTHPRRKKHEVNCEASPGFYIEDVPEVSEGFRPGVVIVLQDYAPELYVLMRKHPEWTDEEYFTYAEEKVRELNPQHEKPDVVDKADD